MRIISLLPLGFSTCMVGTLYGITYFYFSYRDLYTQRSHLNETMQESLIRSEDEDIHRSHNHNCVGGSSNNSSDDSRDALIL